MRARVKSSAIAASLLSCAYAHAGVVGVEVTIVDFSNGFVFADGSIHEASAHLVPEARPADSVTYRIWTHVTEPNDTVVKLIASPDNGVLWVLEDSEVCGSIWNDSSFGSDIDAPDPNLYTVFPSVAYDSWLTIGHDGSANTTGNTSVSNFGWLAQWSAGQGFVSTNGGIFDTSHTPGEDVFPRPGGGYRVLLGQVTMTGESVLCMYGLVSGSGQFLDFYAGCPLADIYSACCLPDGSCRDLQAIGAAAACAAMGGIFSGNDCCTETDCAPTFGACCFDDGTCARIDPAECLTNNGTYQGDGALCRCSADCAPVDGLGDVGNGDVNIDDLVATINAFGGDPWPCDSAPVNVGGPNGNGVVNIDDIVLVINTFGPCENVCGE